MLDAVCVKECPKKLTEFEEPAGSGKKYVKLLCHPTEKNKDCAIPSENFYESKAFIEKICFPKSDDEIEYDKNTQQLIEIYDPETGETFKKVMVILITKDHLLPKTLLMVQKIQRNPQPD